MRKEKVKQTQLSSSSLRNFLTGELCKNLVKRKKKNTTCKYTLHVGVFSNSNPLPLHLHILLENDKNKHVCFLVGEIVDKNIEFFLFLS